MDKHYSKLKNLFPSLTNKILPPDAGHIQALAERDPDKFNNYKDMIRKNLKYLKKVQKTFYYKTHREAGTSFGEAVSLLEKLAA